MSKTQKYSRHKRYYPADVFEEEFSIIRNLRKPTKKEILFKIIVQGNPSFQELRSKIDKSPGTLSWNLSELIKEGIIEKCRKDGKQCYRVINKELLKKLSKKNFQSYWMTNLIILKTYFLHYDLLWQIPFHLMNNPDSFLVAFTYIIPN